MSPHPRNAPFTFEPVSPTESEIYSGISCSEDELDEVARASKRRRIEKWAQEYLDGKELHIFSASLKGPFGRNWTNPWRRTKPQTAKSAPNARILNKSGTGSTTPSTKTKHTREGSEFRATTTSPGVRKELSSSTVLESGDRAKKSKGKVQEVSRKATKGSRTVGDSGKTTISPWSTSRSSPKKQNERPAQPGGAHSASSRDGWLKRRPQNQGHIEPLKSPSPTPISRQRDVKPTPTKMAAKSLNTSGFTPINQRQYNYTKDIGHVTTSSSTLDSFPKADDSKYARHAFGSHKSSTLGNGPRGETSLVSPTKKPPSEAVAIENKVLSHNRRNDDGFHFEYRQPKLPNDTSTRSKESVSAGHNRSKGATQLRESGVSFYDFAVRAQKPVSAKPGHSQAGNCGIPSNRANGRDIQDTATSSNDDSFLASDTFATDCGTAETVESHNITSAQPPPEYAKVPTEAVSLQSTCFAELKSNTIGTNPDKENHDLHLSTQEAVSSAQRSFQDALATPDKEPRQVTATTAVKHSLKCAGSDEPPTNPARTITPFGAVKSPAPRNGVIDRNNSTDVQSINTQVLVEAISPFVVSTAKRVRNRVSFPSNTENDTPSRQKQFRTASAPVLDETSPVSPFEITGFDLDTNSNPPAFLQSSRKPAGAPPNPPPRESVEAPAESLLPPTATASPGTKQDGQHVEDLDNFDLSQAIADAGTFLQSWDVERDLRNFSGNARSSASVPERQPVLGLDG